MSSATYGCYRHVLCMAKIETMQTFFCQPPCIVIWKRKYVTAFHVLSTIRAVAFLLTLIAVITTAWRSCCGSCCRRRLPFGTHVHENLKVLQNGLPGEGYIPEVTPFEVRCHALCLQRAEFVVGEVGFPFYI